MPAFVALRMSSSLSPSMTISMTDSISGVSSVLTRPLSVGQNASLVEANSALYLEPTFEPERTTPPGKGMMTLGILRMASIAASQADSA
jgi:hypothetical protein